MEVAPLISQTNVRFFIYGTGYCCLLSFQSSSVHLLSCAQLFTTPWTAACQASQSIIISWSLLTIMSIESVMPSSHLILCHPLFSCLQSFPASGSFLIESVLCIRWPKYWSFNFSIPVNTLWSPLGWTGWISLQSKGLWRVFSNTTVQKHQFFGTQFSL